MKIRFQNLVETFADMKNKYGIPREDAADALEIDSDQDVDPKDIERALEQVYGKEVGDVG